MIASLFIMALVGFCMGYAFAWIDRTPGFTKPIKGRNAMDCDLKLNGKCRGEKHHGEVCSRLRPLICDVRRRIQAERARKKRQVSEGNAQPLGI